MKPLDDYEFINRLKNRIERQNRRDDEAIARGRAEREKLLSETGGGKDRGDIGCDAARE